MSGNVTFLNNDTEMAFVTIYKNEHITSEAIRLRFSISMFRRS